MYPLAKQRTAGWQAAGSDKNRRRLQYHEDVRSVLLRSAYSMGIYYFDNDVILESGVKQELYPSRTVKHGRIIIFYFLHLLYFVLLI